MIVTQEAMESTKMWALWFVPRIVVKASHGNHSARAGFLPIGQRRATDVAERVPETFSVRGLEGPQVMPHPGSIGALPAERTGSRRSRLRLPCDIASSSSCETKSASLSARSVLLHKGNYP